MVRPDPRTEPAEYAAFLVSEYRRHSTCYRLGLMSESVYRASLKALHWHARDIDTEVRLNAPEGSELFVLLLKRRILDKCDVGHPCALDQPCSCRDWASERGGIRVKI